MKNLTNYNRADHGTTNNYTVISNQLINDNNLNVIDKGIMLMILSNSDNFIYNSIVMQKKSGLGKIAFYSSIKKLITFGYINKQAIQGGYIWTINEAPIIAEQPMEQPMEEQLQPQQPAQEEQPQQPMEQAPEQPMEQPMEEQPIIEEKINNNMEEKEINNEELFAKVEEFILTKNNDIFFDWHETIEHIGAYFSREERIFIKNNFDTFKKRQNLFKLYDRIKMELIAPTYTAKKEVKKEEYLPF